jgi:Ca-activated chloride channel family protein
MSFLHPEFLYYMLPPLFILFGFLLTQKEAHLDFFSDEVINKLRVSSNRLTHKARNALFLLALILMIIALSSPVIKDGEVEVKAKSSDIMIALDISDSMLASDVYPNRLKLSKQKIIDFLKVNSKERVGVIAFAKNSYLVSPLSFDHDAVRFLLSSLNTDSITEKGTNIMSLLEVVSNSSQKSQKHLLILSDGGDNESFEDEINYAKENNIIVFVLAVGSKKGAPIKLENGEFIKYNGDIIISKLNQNISSLATKTGGVYIESVNSDADIKAMINEIKAKTEAKELKSQKVQKYIHLFYYPLGLALMILLIATSSMSKRVGINVPPVFVLAVLMFSSPDLKASLFDFMKLDDAKQAYESGNYKEASKLYSEHGYDANSAEAHFNAGNAYYKNKDYDKAIKAYENSKPNTNDLLANKYANMGNSYAKKGTKNDLQKAKESYEKSLELKDDNNVKENLEEVKKALEKQKQQKQQQNKNNKENNKNKDKQQNNKDKNKQQDKQNNKDKDKQQKQDNKKDSKSKPKDEKPNKDKMSDAEEKKWLERLNDVPNTYMYKLNKENLKQENSDEKPW